MAGNSIGTLFKLTTFGESHGAAVGGVVDGCPAGLPLDEKSIQKALDRRRPGYSPGSTARQETDQIQILSGVFNGQTTGAPIAFLVQNRDVRSEDYEKWKSIYRPSHADFVWEKKYGVRDYRGGGRSSARETLARVAAGAIASHLLRAYGISIVAYVESIGPVKMIDAGQAITVEMVEESAVRCPDLKTTQRMIMHLDQIREQKDTSGGIIGCRIQGCPIGLGDPVFDKLHADLAKSILSINAAKGFEYGEGFAAAAMKGSLHNDPFVAHQGKISTLSNHSGGIQGGISNGAEINFRVAFKPVATLMQTQQSVNQQGEAVSIEPGGRHDVCVVPRAVPIVEAMAALTLADHLLRMQAAGLK